MNIKEILFLLFIGAIGLPFALHSGEFAIDGNQNEVTDWSPSVCKQRENSCAFHAVKNGQVLFYHLSMINDREAKADALKEKLEAEEDSDVFPLAEWQNYINKKVNLEGSELTKIAIDKAGLPREHFTVIDSFEDFMQSFDTGPMLADESHVSLYKALLRLKSKTPSTPHIFFLGSMNHNRCSGIGHWVTCVATVNHNSNLELHYADSMNPGDIQTLDSTERESKGNLWGVTNDELDTLLNENRKAIQTIIDERRKKFTNLLKELIENKTPINLLLTSPLGNSLDSVESLLDQQNRGAALPHLKQAVEYVQNYKLLDDPDFMHTDYPIRLQIAIGETLGACVYPLANDDLKRYSQLIDENSAAFRACHNLPEIRSVQKEQKSWFQKLTSYITPRKVLFAGICAASCWMLKKIVDNNRSVTV